MTVDLELMLALKDQIAAYEVAERAKLGWFDVEFTTYGCAYLQGDERCYRLSSESEKIYDFMLKSPTENIVPTGIYMHTERYPVPAGMKDYVTREVKTMLAREMQEKFPVGFLVELGELAEEATEESARSLLEEQRYAITGLFEAQKLAEFEALLEYALRCRKITLQSYKELAAWLAEERRAMEESIVPKNRYQKTFYGIAYAPSKDGDSSEDVKYFSNAQRSHVYDKYYELLDQGVYATYIYSRTFYYDNQSMRVPELKKLFEADMAAYFAPAFVGRLKDVFASNASLSAKGLTDAAARVRGAYGEAAYETVLTYGRLWGIL